MKKFFAFFVALALASVSIFSLLASAAYYTPTNYDITYSTSYDSFKASSCPYGTLQRVTCGNDLIECYQPHAALYDGRIVFERYGLFTHIFEVNKTVYFGDWKIVYQRDDGGSVNPYGMNIRFYLGDSLVKTFSQYNSAKDLTQFRYGFSLVEYNGKSYIALIVTDLSYWNINSSNIGRTDYYAISFNSITSIDKYYSTLGDTFGMFIFDPCATGKTINTDVDFEGGQTTDDISVKGALTCPSCGSTNVTLIPQPMYDAGSEGGLIYKIRCNDCQDYWHWTFTSSEKQIIEDLKNDPESGFQITYENAVSDNLGDIFDLPRDENGNVIWGDAAGNFGDLMTGTFNGLSSAAVSVVSIFGTIFSFLPEGILALISFAIILCCFIGIFKTLRG